MKPLVAIVGRPNVGKSTFFNRMLADQVAVVEDLPGTTRDRIYGDTDWNGREFTLIDTGGLELSSDIPVGQVGLNGQPGDIMRNVQAQAELAIEEADVIVFMVDARSGITAADEEVANLLRRTEKPVILAANKADNAARRQDAVEFYSLGLGEPIPISSIQGTGTGDLLDLIVEELPPLDETENADEGMKFHVLLSWDVPTWANHRCSMPSWVSNARLSVRSLVRPGMLSILKWSSKAGN